MFGQHCVVSVSLTLLYVTERLQKTLSHVICISILVWKQQHLEIWIDVEDLHLNIYSKLKVPQLILNLQTIVNIFVVKLRKKKQVSGSSSLEATII